jgi:hypothetical protein
MVELYGLRTDYIQHKIGGSFEAEQVRDLLATFDTEREAQAYVKASELVNNSGIYPTYSIYKQFRYRKGSLLRNYTDYEICSPETVSVPHNPVL